MRILSAVYNYPLPHRNAVTPATQNLDLDELVHLHYRLWFHLPDGLAEVSPPFDSTAERYRWLEQRLPLEPIAEQEA